MVTIIEHHTTNLIYLAELGRVVNTFSALEDLILGLSSFVFDKVGCSYDWELNVDFSVGLGELPRLHGDLTLLTVGIRVKVRVLLVDFVSTSAAELSIIPDGVKELVISLASLFKSAVVSSTNDDGLFPLGPVGPLWERTEDVDPLLSVRFKGRFC